MGCKGTRPFAVAESSGFALEGRHDREETQAREPVLVLSAARAPRAAAGAALAVRAPARHQCRHRAYRGPRLAIRRHARLSLPRRVELAPVVRPRRHDPWRHGSLPGARRRRQASKLFEGIYAIYCGLLLIGVTGLILSPVFHRVMHQLHLPDDDDTESHKPKPTSKTSKR